MRRGGITSVSTGPPRKNDTSTNTGINPMEICNELLRIVLIA